MHNSKVENHNTAFLPIYFDFDYGNEFSEMQRSFSILPPASKPDHRTLLLDLAIEKRPRYHQLQSESDCPYRLPKLDKLSPGTIDRGVHAYNSLVKYQSNIYIRNEKLLEIVQFINAMIDAPSLIFESPMRRKNRFEKLTTCVNMIRECQVIENSNIELRGIKGLEKMLCFD